MERKIVFDVHIEPEEYRKLYEGVARNAHVVARDGRRIQFPAKILRPFLTHSGISGSFVIYFDDNHKFKRIDRLK